MPELLTMQDLANGHLDVKALGEAANEDKVVTSRLGLEYASAPMASRIILEQGTIDAFLFLTKADLDIGNALGSDTPITLANDDFALVLDDETLNNNGYYKMQSGELVWLNLNASKQSLAEIELAKQAAISAAAIDATSKADAAISAAVSEATSTLTTKIAILGGYDATVSSSVVSSLGYGYGIETPRSGTVESIKVSVFSGAMTFDIQKYRRNAGKLELLYTAPVSNFVNNSEVVLAAPIPVIAGDFLVLKVTTAGRLRNTNTPLENMTVLLSAAGSSVGDLVNYIPSGSTENNIQFTIKTLNETIESDAKKLVSQSDILLLDGFTNKIFGDIYSSVVIPANTLNNYAYTTNTRPIKPSVISELAFTTRSINKYISFVVSLVKQTDLGLTVASTKYLSAKTNSAGVVRVTGDAINLGIIQPDDFVFVQGNSYLEAPLSTNNQDSWLYVDIAEMVLNNTVTVKNAAGANKSLEVSYLVAGDSVTIQGGASDKLLYSTKLINDSFLFSNVPSGWTPTTGWVASASGLQSPAVGGNEVNLVADNYTAMANRAYRAKIKVNDTASVFSFCTTLIEANAGAAAAIINGTNNTLSITPAGFTPTRASVSIPALVAGRSYQLEVIKNGWFSTITWSDTTTGETTQLNHDTIGSYEQFHGQAAINFNSGSIAVEHFTMHALYEKNCHAILIGDSNSERANIIAGNSTWAYQLADMRAATADVIVAARSGDETPNFIKRKDYDLLIWQPKYVVWALGTNDESQATWRTNMAQNIADTLAIGAEPILATQIPRGGMQALKTAMNQDIRSGYFGDYRYIDFAKAVSLNNDGVTWNPIYNSGDNVHVNPLGQSKMLAQALIDVPDLLY